MRNTILSVILNLIGMYILVRRSIRNLFLKSLFLVPQMLGRDHTER